MNLNLKGIAFYSVADITITEKAFLDTPLEKIRLGTPVFYHSGPLVLGNLNRDVSAALSM